MNKEKNIVFVSSMELCQDRRGPRAIDLEHQRSFRTALPYNHEIAYQPVRSTQYTTQSRVCGC